MKKLTTLFVLWLGLAAACTAAPPASQGTVTGEPVETVATPTLALPANPTPTPAKTILPTATSHPATPTAVPDTGELLAIVAAELPPNAFEGLDILPLYRPEGEPPLWAVFSGGFRNFDLYPVPTHFVALYTFANGRWQALARQDLNVEGQNGFGPDYLFEQSITQVDLDPTNVWLAVDGGVGAHGGTFQLLRYDGTTLRIEIDAGSASAGLGYLEDLNGDGQRELILRLHEYYVFCYACGVRYLNFGVYSWDAAGQSLEGHSLQPLPAVLQDHPAAQPANRAVELANAGLWPEALSQIEAAERLAAETAGSADFSILAWNAALIRLYDQAYRAELNHSPFPLLTQIFYGDYAAALDLMRGLSQAQLFSPASPLIQGTVAEGNEMWLADYILQQTGAAIDVQPDLAVPYFFRAWAGNLVNPADPQINLDLARAAALAPNEPLFVQIAAPTASRIQFDPEATSASLAGQLEPRSAHVYVLRAQAGQQMTVVLSAPGEDARLTVRDARGAFLSGQLTSTVWQGKLPENGDYVIRVFAEETAVDYTLQVTIPQRITFAPGAISATLDGAVDAFESHDYILTAQAGQTMDVVIQSPGNNVLLTIVGADGVPLTNGLMSGASAWTGQLYATQDYTIRASGTSEAAVYTLTVTIQ